MPLMNKFTALSGEIRRRIEAGELCYGEKLPSVRLTARARRLSMTTVVAAYRELEATDLIEARPRSGYYVKFAVSPSRGPGNRLSRADAAVEIPRSDAGSTGRGGSGQPHPAPRCGVQ